MSNLENQSTIDAVLGHQTTSKSEGRKIELPWVQRYFNVAGPLVMIIGLGLVMAIFEPRFFEIANLMIILQDAAIFMVLGMAMTLVITGKGIDLSIGAVAALSAVIMAMLIKDVGMNVYLAMVVGMLVGTTCGVVNGLVITKLRVPDLMATLAMDVIYRGLGLVLAAGTVLARFPDPIPFLGRGHVFGVFPVAAAIGLLALGIGYVLYHHTKLGRYAIAIGANREAAQLTGINVDRQKIYLYALMGLCAAIAGILLTGRLNAIQSTAAVGFTLHTIAAVVVGGTVLFGGRGTMFGTLVGVLLLSMVTNSLVLLRFQFFWQLVAAGVIIIASIASYAYLQHRNNADARQDE
ncbi:Ribose transport system permease protein RbsC [Labrenzia sp. THAF82]|uniref:ABC transporter permease n=1 Tax=Labrenzia sp. THAF82 TaxID=2587861 RepID=UPI001268F256|nr:ABC transporter permease [Labrenzia sp. THAF82]QFT34080.1 Ribose transport system permease protein RbsC [Labrenzia sp. THAF82]